MIQGSSNSLYRGDVSGVLNAISFAEMGFVGLSIFAPAMAASPSDYFWKIDANQPLRMPTPRTADGGNPQRDEYTLSQDNYITKFYEEEAKVTGQQGAQIVSFDLAVTIAKFKVNELLRAQEKRIADLCIDTTTFADDSGAKTGMTPSVKWDVTATNTPIDDLVTGKVAIRKQCGKTPDTLVVGEFIYEKLCISKQVRESLGLRYAPMSQEEARLDPKALAKALGVSRVLIANALYTSSNKGQSTITNDYIWNPDYAFLCVTDASAPGQDANGKLILGEPCIGRTIGWNAFGGLLEVNQYGERVDDKIINVRQHVAEKRLLTSCGFLYRDIMT